MADDGRVEDAGQERDDTAGLPRHLAALVGALNGPSDLGHNHDKYLAYLTGMRPAERHPRDLVRYGAACRCLQQG